MTRRPDDLRRALDARSAEPVDTEGMLAGIRSRIATRRVRRRRAAVVASAGAALLIAAVPIVVNQLDLTGDDDAARSVGTSSATEAATPPRTSSPTTESAASLDPAEIAFTVPTLPPGYRPVTVTTTVGQQLRAYTNFPESPQVPITVTLFDPQVNGGPTPMASAETV